MRVLTLTPFYPTASDDAAGCFVAEPLLALEQFGVSSCVVGVHPVYRRCTETNVGTPRASWISYPCIPGGIGLASAGAFLYASLIAKVRELNRSQPIDVIHAHAALPCGHAAILLGQELNIPCVVTVHGMDAYFDNQVRGHAGQWCRRVAQFVYRSATRVICISGRVAGNVVEGSNVPIKAKVIYNSVDTAVFAPASADLSLDTILSVGNLIPIKGHELLLRALAVVLPQHPQLSCDIIGDGPERPRLTRLTTELDLAGRVRFLGRQSRKQVAEAMRLSSLFVLPSRYEGLGCVYLEAMSAGKVAIACRGQGIDEIIQHKHNGWLLDPDDLQGLVHALSTLLQNLQLRRQIGEAARNTVLQRLTSAHQGSQLSVVYEECAA
jgi:teichuronic acid biosynthesis glycosyltransferase TuaC